MSEKEKEDTETVVWKEPEPEGQEVTEEQLREFQKAFELVKNQLRELSNHYDELTEEYNKELKIAKELQENRRILESERQQWDNEAMIVEEQTQVKPVKVRSPKNDGRSPTYDIVMTTKSISEAKQKIAELMNVLKQEKKLWKGEKTRLLQAIRQQESQRDVLKESIEQFQSYLHEDEEDKVEIQMEVVANPEAKLTQLLKRESPGNSPISATVTPHRSQSRSSRKSINSEVTEAYLEAVRRSPENEQSTFVMPVVDMTLPDYDMDFSYYPTGNIIAKSGKELKYENGETVLKFKNGTQRIKRNGGINQIVFANGDVRIAYPDGAMAYRYQKTGAIEIEMPNRDKYCIFTDGQREIRYENGDKYIVYANRTIKFIKSNGDYQVKTPDGHVETCIFGLS